MIEVWVYTGSGGGAYEFIVRQRGVVSVTGTSNSAAISGLTDRNNAVPIFDGFTCDESNSSNWDEATLAVYIDNSSNVVFSRNNTGNTVVCAYEIVEFIGSAWSVGCGLSSSHDTGNAFPSGGELVTMNTDSSGTGGSTFDVTDWDTALIIQCTMEGDSSERGLSDTLMYALPGTGTTTVRMTLDNSNSRNDGAAYAYVIQCDDLVINRSTNNNFSEGNNSYGTNLTAPSGYNYSTPLSEMALEWYPGTNGEGTAHIRGAVHAQIIDTGSAYAVQHWIHRSGNNVKASYGFADLSALVDAGGGTTEELVGNLTTSSTISSNATLVLSTSSQISTDSQTSSILTLITELTAALEAGSTVSGDANIATALQLLGQINTGSINNADMTVLTTLAAQLNTSSITDAAITLIKALAGSVDTDSAVQGAATIILNLQGSINTGSVTSSNLEIATSALELVGDIIAGTNVASNLTVLKALTNSISTDSQLSGELTMLSSLLGNINTNSNVTAVATTLISLMSNVNTNSTLTGDLTILNANNLPLIGNVLTSSTVLGDLTAILRISKPIRKKKSSSTSVAKTKRRVQEQWDFEKEEEEVLTIIKAFLKCL
jgi:hypothetical protein